MLTTQQQTLRKAIKERDLQTVEDLIDQGLVQVYEKLNTLGYTVLHFAARKGHAKIVALLLQKLLEKGDFQTINAKNDYGETALHIAILKEKKEVALCLLDEEKFDITLTDNNGETVLHVAARKGDAKIVALLLQKLLEKGDFQTINAKNNDGETALHIAIIEEKKEVALCLLDKEETDMTLTDNDGETVLHNAVYNGDQDIVENVLQKLLEKGDFQTINAKNNDGETALNIAHEEEYQNIIDILEHPKNFMPATGGAQEEQEEPSLGQSPDPYHKSETLENTATIAGDRTPRVMIQSESSNPAGVPKSKEASGTPETEPHKSETLQETTPAVGITPGSVSAGERPLDGPQAQGAKPGIAPEDKKQSTLLYFGTALFGIVAVAAIGCVLTLAYKKTFDIANTKHAILSGVAFVSTLVAVFCFSAIITDDRKQDKPSLNVNAPKITPTTQEHTAEQGAAQAVRT